LSHYRKLIISIIDNFSSLEIVPRLPIDKSSYAILIQFSCRNYKNISRALVKD